MQGYLASVWAISSVIGPLLGGVFSLPAVSFSGLDDIDLVTGMTRYSGVPVSLHPA